MDEPLLLRTLSKYLRRAVLLDANLLVLLIVGSVRPGFLRRFERTSHYSEVDYELLARTVGAFARRVTTPHILTEVSNLLGQRGEPDRTELRRRLAQFVCDSKERIRAARRLVAAPEFFRFGLTDAAILDARPGAHLVLTDDIPLAGQLRLRGVDVLRFQDLRNVCL